MPGQWAIGQPTREVLSNNLVFVTLFASKYKSLSLEDLGEGIASSSNSVDNVRLIEVNDAIRSHEVEVVGKTLRGYMTDMKKIVEANL